MTDRARHASLGAPSALLGWCAVLAVLNLTAQPLVCGALFGSLSLLAVAVGRRRLVVTALVLGAGVAIAEPLLSLLFASMQAGGTGVAHTAFAYPQPLGGAYAVLAALRVPAEVVSVVLLTLVAPQQAITLAARVSARTALVGALAARLGPLLVRDARRARDELRCRGVRFGAAPVGERARSWLLLWEALVGGAFDRAFATAAALDTRGYGARRVTREPLRDARLAATPGNSPRADAAFVAAALALLGSVVAARAAGSLPAPTFAVFAGATGAVTATAGLCAVLATLAPLLALRIVTARGDACVRSPSSAPADHVAPPAAPPAAGGGVALESVRVTYPRAATPALAGVDLHVAAGEFVLLAGDSGSGKSTLLDTVSGVVPHSTGGSLDGTVRVAGASVAALAPRARLGTVATVFQDPERQVVSTTAAEEVAFGLRNLALPIADVERRSIAALEQLGCGHLAHRTTGTLSGGELQRVVLAAALALRPRVLVLDEPTSQLDAVGAAAFWRSIDELRRAQGITVVASEHRLEHVLGFVDRVVSVADGRVVGHCVATEFELPPASPGALPSPRSGPPRLVVRGLAVRTPGAVVTSSLELSLPPGATVAVLGANGVGKSSLLRALAGLDEHGGAVFVDGVMQTVGSPAPRAIGIRTQHAATLVAGATVRAHASLTLNSLGASRHVVDQALADAGLDALSQRHPHDLSLGERQRLSLVAATVHAPPVWLLDEPSAALDATGRRWLHALLARHAARGGVALVATHDADLARACSHQLALHGGGVATLTQAAARTATPMPRRAAGPGVLA